ncbi:alpha-ketoacid dehydrogenase subunit beta [Candidatus Bathyarchaeota archaeon]|nr:alpha-ketoacid dehydrogenase subunit beta [Candidatus Bathyarchaeota archaeon]
MPERIITMSEALNEAMFNEMKKNSDIILLGENVSSSFRGPTKGLKDAFGRERVRDAPISETSFIGAGIGAAITGLRPIVELMLVDFGLVAMDQILNQMGKTTYMSGGAVKIPITLRAVIGAGTSSGATHSESLYSLFAHMPGIKVVLPSTPYDAKGLLTSSIRENCPKVFLEHRLLYNVKGNVPKEEYTIPLGVANTCNEGNDVTIVASGLMLHESLKAAEKIKNKVSVEVIDPRTIYPLDEETILKSLQKTGRLIVVDEDYRYCGFSAEIAALAAEKAFKQLKGPIYRLATPNTPFPFNPRLERELLPNAEKIEKLIQKVIGE